MPKELKKLESEWKAVKISIDTAYRDMDSAKLSMGNLKQWLEGAQEALVDEAKEAKAKGIAEGDSADGYMKVPGFRKIWDEAAKTLKSLEDATDRYAGVKVTMAQIVKDATAIADEATSEVAARKKKKIGSSDSVPGLEALADEINKALNISKTQTLAPAKLAKQKIVAFDYDKKFKNFVDTDIKDGTNSVKSKVEDDFSIERLDPRHLSAVVGKLQTSAATVTKLCADAVTARQAGNAGEAKTAFDKAIKLASAAQKLSEEYGADLKKHVDEVKAHKKGKAILTRMNELNGTVKAMLTELSKTQKAMA